MKNFQALENWYIQGDFMLVQLLQKKKFLSFLIFDGLAIYVFLDPGIRVRIAE
jgi:hypothetical protein